MAHSFFITGTDTGIGKTFITALIATALREQGIDVGVMKPVETGYRDKGGSLIPSDATLLKEAAKTEDALDLINPFRFRLPAAPSIAAREEGAVIECGSIKDSFELLAERHDTLLGFAAGVMLYVISDEIIPETHRRGYEREATFGLIGGFCVMLVLDNMFT
jgi:dethiobiotin synthetase